MSIRELWDTIVLRDILGYIFPGAVTLFALTLLVAGFEWTTLHKLVADIAGFIELDCLYQENWVRWRPWLVAAVFLPLSYVVGHVQIRIIEHFERRQPWNLGGLALKFLEEDKMGLDYCDAALELLGPKQEHRFEEDPLMMWIREAKKQRDEERKNKGGEERQKEAENLWRLCDRYVLKNDPHTHAMFMGRYYVLAVLFSNLGVSTVLLSACVLVLVFPAHVRIPAALVEVAVALSTLWLVHGQWPKLTEQFAGVFPIWFRLVMAGFLIVGVVLLSNWHHVCGVAVSLISGGAFLVHRSGYFRRRFVECTFPIFYALTVP